LLQISVLIFNVHVHARGFQHDLEALMEHIQNPKVLKEHVRKLHEAHGAAPVDAVVLDDSNIEDLQR
jgi:hypothetical protein